MENVRNRVKVAFIRKDDKNKILKQQSKLSFNGFHKSYEVYDSYLVKQNEVLMDKPFFLCFTVLELSKLLTYETYYDKLQLYFGDENETPEIIRINEFVALRSIYYAFNCGDDSKNKLKGISNTSSKFIKFYDYRNCLDGGKHQKECDNYIIRSLIREMYLQLVKKINIIYI